MLDGTHTYRSFVCAGCNYTFKAPLSCGDRFCPICSGPRRRKIQAKLKAIVKSLPSDPSFTVKMLTLTIPNQKDINHGTKLILRSFRRLRQRQFFRNRCRGGAWVVEITGAPGRWHVHLHAMLESRFIPNRMLSREWAKVSPGRIVHIKRYPPAVVVRYITAYLAKSEMDPTHRREVSQSLKGLRLFQPFGSWHAIALSVLPIKYCCPSCDRTYFVMCLDESTPSYVPKRAPPNRSDASRYDSARSRAVYDVLDLPVGTPLKYYMMDKANFLLGENQT